jgi:drug/metabolite transporter (DMT)-like permease
LLQHLGSDLNSTVIILVIVSTFMHAGWNLLIRRRNIEAVIVARMLFVTVLVGLVPMAVSEIMTRSLPAWAWVCVAGSGVCCGFYYLGLTRAYGSSDFTVVYPVARALPILLVAFGDVLLGRQPTLVGWVGICLVIGGCLLAPLKSFRGFALGHYFNRATFWIALTALGTVGYTLLDKSAADVVRQGPATAARYAYLFVLFSYIVYILLLRVTRTRHTSAMVKSIGWKIPVLACILNFGADWLVLWAYQSARQASYILALRQFSIIIGVIVAFSIFKEQGRAVRLTGTVIP